MSQPHISKFSKVKDLNFIYVSHISEVVQQISQFTHFNQRP